MEKHHKLNDDEFEVSFASRSFQPEVFSHEAHLRLAWIHINKYGIDRAIQNINNQLLDFVNMLGAADKYNQTVTTAAIRAVYHFMLKSSTSSFQEFILENPRLKSQFKDLLFSHYKTDIFKSEKAKREYLEPELLPFD
jgi:hypothetical protein